MKQGFYFEEVSSEEATGDWFDDMIIDQHNSYLESFWVGLEEMEMAFWRRR
jgi:hypothetical protein